MITERQIRMIRGERDFARALLEVVRTELAETQEALAAAREELARIRRILAAVEPDPQSSHRDPIRRPRAGTLFDALERMAACETKR